jgi:hypothetical protein
VLDIVLSTPKRFKGFVAQEDFLLDDILNNRFGRYYRHGGNNLESASLVARGKTGHQRVGGKKRKAEAGA